MEKISDLTVADRVEIFRHLAVDDLDRVQLSILDSISSKHLDSFTDFCNKVFQEKELIDNISCTLKDGILYFDIQYK